MDQRINRSEKKKSLSVASVLSDLTSLGACVRACSPDSNNIKSSMTNVIGRNMPMH